VRRIAGKWECYEVRVTDETHRKLLRVMGTLQAKEGKRKTVEDAILFLLDEHERNVKVQEENKVRVP